MARLGRGQPFRPRFAKPVGLGSSWSATAAITSTTSVAATPVVAMAVAAEAGPLATSLSATPTQAEGVLVAITSTTAMTADTLVAMAGNAAITSTSTVTANPGTPIVAPPVGGGGSRRPLFTQHTLPATKSKPRRAPVPVAHAATIWATAKIVSVTGLAAKPLRALVATARIASISAVAGVPRVAMAGSSVIASGTDATASPSKALSGTAAIRSCTAADGTPSTERASLGEILSRTSLVATAEVTHRWTLEERNRHAVLYSRDPALAARAYQKVR